MPSLVIAMPRRLFVVGAMIALSGCAASTQPPMEAAPSPPPPRPAELLHTLVLTSPPGQGSIQLVREHGQQRGEEAATYRASGSIVATDDIGQWRFAYTKTSLEGPGPTPGEWINGLHAVSMILVNRLPNTLEVDWETSVFLDPSGLPQRIIHRGVQLNQALAEMMSSYIPVGATMDEFAFPWGKLTYGAPGRASVWNSPAVLERLVPGSGFSITLSLRAGGDSTRRTFTFSAVATPPAGGTR